MTIGGVVDLPTAEVPDLPGGPDDQDPWFPAPFMGDDVDLPGMDDPGLPDDAPGDSDDQDPWFPSLFIGESLDCPERSDDQDPWFPLPFIGDCIFLPRELDPGIGCSIFLNGLLDPIELEADLGAEEPRLEGDNGGPLPF